MSVIQESAFTGGVCYSRVYSYRWGVLVCVIQESAFTGGVKSLLLLVGPVTQECFYWWGLFLRVLLLVGSLKSLLLLVGFVSECYSRVLLLVGSVSKCYLRVLLLVGSVTQECFYWWGLIRVLLLVGYVTPESAFTSGVCYSRVRFYWWVLLVSVTQRCFYWWGLLRVCIYWWGLLLLSLLLLLGSVTRGSAFTGVVCYSRVCF